jgi:SSS family solute:Na+ symporter
VSLARPARADSNRITMQGIAFRTSRAFNISSAIIIAILTALYWTWW